MNFYCTLAKKKKRFLILIDGTPLNKTYLYRVDFVPVSLLTHAGIMRTRIIIGSVTRNKRSLYNIII